MFRQADVLVSLKYMAEPQEREWPTIDSAYTDEYGQVQVEVYMAAGAIWNAARRFALLILQDSHAGSRLLLRATVIVSLKRTEPDAQIDDLTAYLFQTYKRLVLDELRKENRRKEIQAERRAELNSLSINITEDMDRKILLEQIVRRMDPWLRGVYELRCLGYDFDVIAKSLGEKTNVVRSKFSKRVAHLMNDIKEETRRDAERSQKRDCSPYLY
jgi:DNA-directed RNA polymerase specialized sigma24 family protein